MFLATLESADLSDVVPAAKVNAEAAATQTSFFYDYYL